MDSSRRYINQVAHSFFSKPPSQETLPLPEKIANGVAIFKPISFKSAFYANLFRAMPSYSSVQCLKLIAQLHILLEDQYFPIEELIGLLNNTDEDGSTLTLHLAFNRNNQINLEMNPLLVFLNFIKKEMLGKLQSYEIYNFLVKQNNQGQHLGLIIARFYDAATFSAYLDLLKALHEEKEGISVNEIVALFMLKDKEEKMTLAMLLVKFQEDEMITHYFDFMKYLIRENVDISLLLSLFTQKNNESTTVGFLLINSFNKQSLLNYFSLMSYFVICGFNEPIYMLFNPDFCKFILLYYPQEVLINYLDLMKQSIRFSSALPDIVKLLLTKEKEEIYLVYILHRLNGEEKRYCVQMLSHLLEAGADLSDILQLIKMQNNQPAFGMELAMQAVNQVVVCEYVSFLQQFRDKLVDKSKFDFVFSEKYLFQKLSKDKLTFVDILLQKQYVAVLFILIKNNLLPNIEFKKLIPNAEAIFDYLFVSQHYEKESLMQSALNKEYPLGRLLGENKLLKKKVEAHLAEVQKESKKFYQTLFFAIKSKNKDLDSFTQGAHFPKHDII